MKKLLFAGLILLSACSLGDHPQVVTYTVNAVNTAAQNCHVKSTLKIIEPTVAPGIDSQRIAVMQDGNRINYYTGVKWTAPVPQMLEQVLVNSFEQAKIFSAVISDEENASADFELLTDIRDYEVDNLSNGNIHIRLEAKLVGARDRKVLATILVEKIVTPDAYKTEDIVASFNSATADAVQEITSETSAALPKCKLEK